MASASPRGRTPRGRTARGTPAVVRSSGFLLREAASAGNLDGVEAQLGGLDGVDVDDAGTVREMGPLPDNSFI